jgi:signal transduction histidine kinase
VKWESVNFVQYFGTVFNLLKKLSYQSEIDFQLDLGADVPVSGLLPRSTLMQVLLNLGFNAVKHATVGKVPVV